MGPPPSLAVILYHPQAAQTRKAQESQSAFHTICSFLESHGQEGSANTLHSRLQGGSSQGHSHETFRGEQTCLLCPAHIISTYINFYWCPSVFPIPNWDTLAQGNSEKRGKTQSGQGRKSPILLPSFTNLTSSIPEFKVKGSFHQEPSTTTFQFSEREECHFTGHLNILPSRKLFTILGNQREKPSVQIIFHKTTGLWQVWCEQTALLNVPLWCLDMLVRRRWIHSARTHRMCSQGSRATPWISNWSGFQGAFHLCQDKLVLLIPTSFIMASHPTGNGTLKHVLGRVSQYSGNPKLERTLHQAQPELQCSVTKAETHFKHTSRKAINTHSAASELYLQEVMPGGKWMSCWRNYQSQNWGKKALARKQLKPAKDKTKISG